MRKAGCLISDAAANQVIEAAMDAIGSNEARSPAPLGPGGELQEVGRLAELSPMEYDRHRVAAAERLGIRVTTLDREVEVLRIDATSADNVAGRAFELTDPEPWPAAINGAELLDVLVRLIQTYVALPPHAVVVIVLWVLHAHTLAAAWISPILAIVSPVLGCGKTTLIGILAGLTPRALPSSNITAASLFRAIEKWEPTLIVDEADSFLRDNEELRGILNSSHNRRMAFVIRCAGEDTEPRQFTTWCAKAIALIGKLPDTLTSRSIQIEMNRLKPGETVELLQDADLSQLKPFQRQAWRWGRDHLDQLKAAKPRLPNFHLRKADNWRPLIAIADAAGGEWPERARRAAMALEVSSDDDAVGVVLLQDLAELFANREADRHTSEEIVEALASMDDRPWPECNHGKPISKNGLAKILKPFKIHSRNVKTAAGKVMKGYMVADFAEAFSRYIPSRNATPLPANVDSGFGDFRTATTKSKVAYPDCAKTNADRRGSGVAFQEPPNHGFDEEEHF